MERPSIEIVQDRLERLERNCRLWRWLGTAAVLALVVAAAALLARRNDVRSEIRARSLWIVDEHNRPLVRIGPNIEDKNNNLIQLLNESGRPSVEMGIASASSPFIRLTLRTDGMNLSSMLATNVALGSPSETANASPASCLLLAPRESRGSDSCRPVASRSSISA